MSNENSKMGIDYFLKHLDYDQRELLSKKAANQLAEAIRTCVPPRSFDPSLSPAVNYMTREFNRMLVNASRKQYATGKETSAIMRAMDDEYNNFIDLDHKELAESLVDTMTDADIIENFEIQECGHPSDYAPVDERAGYQDKIEWLEQMKKELKASS